MDKFRIDGHKYMFHPAHAATTLGYTAEQHVNQEAVSYKNQLPLYMEVSPVGACNHRCTFCAVDYIGYKSIFMDINHFKRTIDSIRSSDCKSIMFAGEGEPLLHPNINEFVQYTKDAEIDVSFTTNGFKLTEDFLNESLSCVSWIKVSFNGGDADTYSKIHRTSANDFYLVSDNIRRAVEYKKKNDLDVNIGLQTLLLPDNKDSIENLCVHAKDLGVDYLVIKPYSQHKFSNTQIYANIEYSEYLDFGERLSKYSSDTFQVVFRINTVKNWLSQNENRYCQCLATPSAWAYIMADGSVYTCSAYLLDQRFFLGNINDRPLRDIWCSKTRLEHADFVLNELDISECRVNCRMDQVNRYLDCIKNKSVPHMSFI